MCLCAFVCVIVSFLLVDSTKLRVYSISIRQRHTLHTNAHLIISLRRVIPLIYNRCCARGASSPVSLRFLVLKPARGRICLLCSLGSSFWRSLSLFSHITSRDQTATVLLLRRRQSRTRNCLAGSECVCVCKLTKPPVDPFTVRASL